MHIGKQIKSNRIEKNMTQSELAKALNVSRSTVSNWETERNYPDIQLIISLARVLDVPLETLLPEDSEVVKNISNDTKEKNRNKLKIKVLYILLFVLIVLGLIYIFHTNMIHQISDKNQIISIEESNDTIEINTKLPVYRSLTGYYADLSPHNKDVLQVSLIAPLDFSMKNQETISIPLSETEFSEVTQIDFINEGKIFKSIKLHGSKK